MTMEKAAARRFRLLIALLALWGLVIAARLWSLQVIQAGDFRESAQGWQEETRQVIPPRGKIYDSDLNELAVSSIVEGSVVADPHQIENPKEAAKILSRITGVSYAKLLERLSSKKYSVSIKRKISDAERSAIKKAGLRGVRFEEEYRRFYPNREMAAHVLGYVGVDEEGRGGLEYRYNDIVQGERGEVTLVMDAHGKTFERVEKRPRPGADLITTIDPRVQFIIESELKQAAAQTRATGIYIIAQDPTSGAILGMANHPTFNPNEYLKYKPEVWINRAVSQTYEPGSTFKIVTAAAALEEGLTTPDELIDCLNGHIVLFGHRINDHKPFGILTVSQIMQKSSDVGIIKLGLRVGNDRFADYIGRLGFGRLTSVDLPGDEDGQTKPAHRWTKHSIGSISMGQEIAATPLQIVNMVSAVANGGILYRPYVVQKVKDPLKGITETKPFGQRVMSAKTALQLQGMLEEVVTEGTGKNSRLEGYRAAGKTGTAQKIDPKTRAYSRTKYVASFAGFAPASKPLVSIVVVVDEPVGKHGGGEVAAPIFKRIAEQILVARSVAPDMPDYAPTYVVKPEKKPEQTVPLPPDHPGVTWKAVDASLTPAMEDRSYEAGDITVPDFAGLTLRTVSEELRKLGLRADATGSGRAVAQQPSPGARVRSGTVVKVRFSVR
jgi:cell division protein FtsI (penicillin-binding protein 3)